MSKRTELTSRISGDTGIAKTVVDDVLSSLINIAMEDVLNTGTFTIPDIATINVYERKPMRYMNVRTHEYEMTKNGYKVNAVASHHIKSGVKKAAQE